ncbi:inactive peptidyl-prolyl cis-trans isomerase FKBP6-like [Microplitis mediator]|uniref:inactive peptidyl-prolyl cis-trans isomerase FKBP6-like n=1 Tax=Microplitis mediator TaxID=375433 RepID=UPI0025545840|nr:inactive peptidyl-prolyl cis-trans isomerase FKBP6-like [Microplitis mediator]
MAKIIDPVLGVSLRDLMSDDGMVFNFGNEFAENNDDDTFKFDQNIDFTDDELLKFMNLEISDDENENDNKQSGNKNDDGDDENSKVPMSPGFNFDKIKEKMINLRDDGKIKKLILKNGIGETVAKDSQIVIKYSGYLEGQDNPFDSTYQRHCADRYRLNRGELIHGLELSIQSMKKHEVSAFLIDPDLAYGEIGCWPNIPGNSEVLFIVNLIDYADNIAADDYESLEPEERKVFNKIEKFIENLLLIGADNYKRGQTKRAIRDYKRAIDRLEESKFNNNNNDDNDEEERYKSLISRAYQNLALCYNKEDMPRKACIACNNVINKTAKTYFHYGRALIKMGEYKEALEKLNLALEMSPRNDEIMKEIGIADKLQRKNLKTEKDMWSNCLGMEKLTSEIKNIEYKKIANEFCNNFINNNDVIRQPLPDGIDLLLKDSIRKAALLLDIKVTSVNKYGKESLYLEKSNYQ